MPNSWPEASSYSHFHTLILASSYIMVIYPLRETRRPLTLMQQMERRRKEWVNKPYSGIHSSDSYDEDEDIDPLTNTHSVRQKPSSFDPGVLSYMPEKTTMQDTFQEPGPISDPRNNFVPSPFAYEGTCDHSQSHRSPVATDAADEEPAAKKLRLSVCHSMKN